MRRRTTATRLPVAALAAAGALLVVPAIAQANLFIDAKSFSTQEATSLARSTIATFSDDHTPGTPCSANGYTSTVDWGDGTPVQPATVTFRFGGDFGLCEFTVNADHKYAHFGVFTTTVSVTGGPQAHSGSDVGEITVADVNIAGAFRPFTAAAGTVFNGVVAEFKDANGLSQPGDFTSTIDWGDGSPVITGTIGGANGDFTVAGTHTYAAPGTYTVRSTLQHPTGPPAVAVGTVTVGAAPAGGGGAGGGGGGAAALPTMRLLHTSLSARTLVRKGLAIRLSTGPTRSRTLNLEILRNGKHFARSTLRLARTDGKVQTVRWRPSASLVRRLRPGRQYALRIRVGNPAQTLTRPFRLTAAPRR